MTELKRGATYWFEFIGKPHLYVVAAKGPKRGVLLRRVEIREDLALTLSEGEWLGPGYLTAKPFVEVPEYLERAIALSLAAVCRAWEARAPGKIWTPRRVKLYRRAQRALVEGDVTTRGTRVLDPESDHFLFGMAAELAPPPVEDDSNCGKCGGAIFEDERTIERLDRETGKRIFVCEVCDAGMSDDDLGAY